MELDRIAFQNKRRIVNIDPALVTSQILDGRKEYTTEIHTLTELFSKPEVRDIFLYEEGVKDDNPARIAQRVFVVGQIESEPDSALVSVLLDPAFKDIYSDAEQTYSDSVNAAKRKAKKKGTEQEVEVPKPRIIEHAQVKGNTLEISVKHLAKEATAPLHKGDTVVYRAGTLVVEDASGEESYHYFGVYALKKDKDSLVLD